jgi:hypothetical protein
MPKIALRMQTISLVFSLSEFDIVRITARNKANSLHLCTFGLRLRDELLTVHQTRCIDAIEVRRAKGAGASARYRRSLFGVVDRDIRQSPQSPHDKATED